MTAKEYKTCLDTAARVCKSWNALELLEDAAQETAIAYWKAQEKFDPAKGDNMGYAKQRLDGAAQDWIRVWRGSRKGSLSALVSVEEHGDVFILPSNEAPFDTRYFQREETRRMIAKLDHKPRYQELIVRHYLYEETLESIGRDFGVNGSRATQIKNAAIKIMQEGE